MLGREGSIKGMMERRRGLQGASGERRIRPSLNVSVHEVCNSCYRIKTHSYRPPNDWRGNCRVSVEKSKTDVHLQENTEFY